MSRRSTMLQVAVVLATIFIFSAQAWAVLLEFVPPNDTTGAIFSTNSNDLYSSGRGDVFTMTSNVTIDLVGIRQNLRDIDLNFDVAETLGTTGQVTTGETILRSGHAVVNTGGSLQFIDFGIAPLTLLAGHSYHIEFSFNGSSVQNFFYNNGNVPFSTDGFSLIDGTQNGNAGNFVMPSIHVNTIGTTVVPEPASLTLIGSGFAAIAALAWRQRRARPR